MNHKIKKKKPTNTCKLSSIQIGQVFKRTGGTNYYMRIPQTDQQRLSLYTCMQINNHRIWNNNTNLDVIPIESKLIIYDKRD